MIDLTDIPTTACSCGCTVFKTLVALDPDTYQIGWYTLTGYCTACDNRVSFPEPIFP